MRSTILLLAVLASAFSLFGCSKETDPHTKYDIPGYYNGPMDSRGGKGGGGTGGGAGAQQKTAPGPD